MNRVARPIATLVGIAVFAAAVLIAVARGVDVAVAVQRGAVSAGVCAATTWVSINVARNVLREALRSRKQDQKPE